jgi:hypothetical protein
LPRKPDLDAVLSRLRELRGGRLARERDPELLDELRAILGSRRADANHAAAPAAAFAADAHLDDLVPDLVSAFEHFLENPVKRDPGCRAKTAVVDALQQLDASEGDLYLLAARHVQLEPVYGGRQDTAAELRGAAGRGLVRMNHPDALLVHAELLVDPELPTRMAAARAVAWHGGRDALPLLRLKALAGDGEIEVVGACLLGMLQVSADDSVAFVSRFLDVGRAARGAARAEAALLALGESRVPEALAVLQGFYTARVDAGLARTALLAAAMMRSDAATEWLLALVANEPGPIAREAIAAFEIHRSDERLAERVRAAASREDLDLGSALEEALGPASATRADPEDRGSRRSGKSRRTKRP